MSRAAYDLARYYRRRALAIDLLGGSCVECRSTDNLHFDHIDASTKTYDVSGILLHGWDKVKMELEKCQLLCRTCHENKTLVERNSQLSAHGTLNRYRKYKCRCDTCKKAVAKYKGEWRRKRKLAGLKPT